MAHFGAVSAGQRYVKTYHFTHDQTEWEVVEVKNVGAALPHAQLVNCRDPFDVRTVSCAELMAGGAFDLAAEAPAPDVETGDTGHEPTGALAASGASIGRLLRDITQAVRQFKGSRRRNPLKIKSVVAAARGVRRVI